MARSAREYFLFNVIILRIVNNKRFAILLNVEQLYWIFRNSLINRLRIRLCHLSYLHYFHAMHL